MKVILTAGFSIAKQHFNTQMMTKNYCYKTINIGLSRWKIETRNQFPQKLAFGLAL